ncbi:hypothetical protein I302_100237 [Kwoniella bestiolae CBS 10118]|uniref:AAA domain-containing protein n=1 Tax=Kwoniella bestiolae CBS 10118 TaxID=1296100 RepID=A0A1B9G4H3_9TREE|nr:hypothetical protein I302_03611 [Kwoniella bestiolae CBS 10118]OCF25935.1 hypothetical protein I302_03611 [Kwoniella bestiolae CBS 10118]
MAGSPLIIILNGFPGVGKRTIAKNLLVSFPEARLFDNHLLIDATAAVLERDSEAYHPLRKAFRTALFSTLSSYPSSIPPILVFTECQSSDPSGCSVMDEYLSFTRTVNAKFISIILNCSIDENAQRLTQQGRKREGGTKLTDTKVLRIMREEHAIHRYETKADREWVIDTTGRRVEDAVGEVRMRLLEFWSSR